MLVYLATLMLWRTMTRPTSSTNMITVTATTATTSPATAAQPAPAVVLALADPVDEGEGEAKGVQHYQACAEENPLPVF